MNEKHALYAVLMAFLSISAQSFSMYPAIFKGVQAVSTGLYLGYASANAIKCGIRVSNYEKLSNEKHISENLELLSEEKPSYKLITSEMDRRGIARQKIFYSHKKQWSAGDNTLVVPDDFVRTIDSVQEQINDLLHKRALLEQSKSTIDRKKRIDYLDNEINTWSRIKQNFITKHMGVLGHELGHIFHKDHTTSLKVQAAIPVAVQAVASGATYSFNRLFSPRLPKTMLSTMLCSSLAVGSLPLKVACGVMGMSLYGRYYEKRADLYSCMNAQNKVELEGFKDYMQKHANEFNRDLLHSPEKLFYEEKSDHIGDMVGFNCDKYGKLVTQKISQRLQGLDEKSDAEKQMLKRVAHWFYDPVHPYPNDRVTMIQEHIDKWDAEHKEA